MVAAQHDLRRHHTWHARAARILQGLGLVPAPSAAQAAP